MMNKIYLTSLILITLLIIYAFAVRVSNQRKYEQEFWKGIQILKDNNAKIYAGGGFYLNLENAKWQDGSFIIRNRHPLSIGTSKFIYIVYDNKNAIVVADIHNEEEIYVEESVQHIVRRKTYSIALAKDDDKLAYVIWGDEDRKIGPYLVIHQVSTKEKKIYKNLGRIWDLCWSEDSRTLFFVNHKGINQINVSNGCSEFVASGYWPKVLANNRLGYWRGSEDGSVCYLMDLSTRTEEELFSLELEYYLRGADWSPDSRYVIVMVFADFLFFGDAIGLPILIETENGNRYRLPTTTNAKYTESKFKLSEIEWR